MIRGATSLNLLPTRAKNPCQPLLVFLNGLVGYKCCQPTIVCSAILSAIVFFFKLLYIWYSPSFNLSKLCLSSVSAICMFFMYCTLFDVLCFTPGPNWKTVFTLSFVTQAKEVLINR